MCSESRITPTCSVSPPAISPYDKYKHCMRTCGHMVTWSACHLLIPAFLPIRNPNRKQWSRTVRSPQLEEEQEGCRDPLQPLLSLGEVEEVGQGVEWEV